ncbi:hypothetical protein C1H46_004237 [Malus baccata]|uniref:Uncharacterized protein n=1 Tax=Malus baccata TaxID=106549 RepID=A0A540NGH3_MALBA|nr:hypothetical protein C1H46_004237 [Malus baccata]
MSHKGGGSASSLPKDVPWRASNIKPIPKIHHSPLLRIAPNPTSNYALSVMKHPNPVGSGLAMEAIVESAGPDCIVPGQVAPIKLLGLKVWPFEVNFKFLEPVGRELKQLGKGGWVPVISDWWKICGAELRLLYSLLIFDHSLVLKVNKERLLAWTPFFVVSVSERNLHRC